VVIITPIEEIDITEIRKTTEIITTVTIITV
jgi:hypothetical protein